MGFCLSRLILRGFGVGGCAKPMTGMRRAITNKPSVLGLGEWNISRGAPERASAAAAGAWTLEFGAFLILACNAQAWQMKQAPLMTQWASQIDTNNPLPEYPRPQMVRSNWLNLNGIWQFQAGATNDPVPTNQTLSTEILVPYPMESAISGIMQYYQFAWYRRLFTVPPAWSGRRIILHLDAVDWQSQIFINGQSLGIHQGGYDSATYDITAQLTGSGPHVLI